MGRELEQPLGDARVRPGQPPRCGRHEALLVSTQVDRDVVHREKLGHSLHRCLERVRERELGRRLAHDREQGARALELERQGPGALARPEGMCSAHPERRQPPELERRRCVSRAEEQLEDARGCLPERKRHRDATATGKPLGGHGANGARLVEHLAGELARTTELGPGLDPIGAHELELPGGAFPEEADRCPDNVRGNPNDLGPGMPLAERGGERIPSELEGGANEQLGRTRLAGPEGAEDERRLAARELSRDPFALSERGACAI